MYSPPQNFSGNTFFDYTIVDANNEQSTARVFVVVHAVADKPEVVAKDATGFEGEPIQLNLSAQLVDQDGSESLQILLHNVPDIAFFVDSDGNPIGRDLGKGDWEFTPVEFENPFVVVRDNGTFELELEAIATEADNRVSQNATAKFVLTVGNSAPAATIMEAPDSTTKDETIVVRMAANDASSIDQASGFTYRIDWGDGSDIQVVRGQPGVGPTVPHVYTRPGVFTISVTATDKDGAEGPAVKHRLRVSFTGLVNDPLHPGQRMLFVDGSDNNDDIRIVRNQAVLDLYRDGALDQSFEIPDSRIVVMGYDGDDSLFVDANVDVDAWLFGGSGDDTLFGSNGNSILVGGEGLDLIRGRSGHDILIGGRQRDVLFGGAGENVLVAGFTLFDDDEAALLDIQQEWTSNGALKNHVARLKGEKQGGLNGSTFLRSASSNSTAFDDGAVDQLMNNKNHDWIFVNTDAAFSDLFGNAKFQDELDPVDGEGEVFGPLGQQRDNSNHLRRQAFLMDVNGDQYVSPLDALLLINRLNQPSNENLLDETETTDYLFDVNLDSRLSPIDVLLVINRLNNSRSSDLAAGELDSTITAVVGKGTLQQTDAQVDIEEFRRLRRSTLV